MDRKWQILKKLLKYFREGNQGSGLSSLSGGPEIEVGLEAFNKGWSFFVEYLEAEDPNFLEGLLPDLQSNPKTFDFLEAAAEDPENHSEDVFLQELFGWEDTVLHRFYAIASDAFEREDFEASASAFSFLVTINPGHQEFWLGLGLSRMNMNENYEEALDALFMAVALDIHNPFPYYYYAQVLDKAERPKEALASLALCEEELENYESGEALSAAVQRFKNRLEEDLEDGT